MERNERLEQISNRIRGGEPVGFLEAIEAIEYQSALKADRDELRHNVWWRRLLRKLNGHKDPSHDR